VTALSFLPERVRRFLDRHALSPAGLVVAVSGGPDSVALLRALLHVRREGTPLVLAHLNHQLRGDESDADEAFVRNLFDSLRAKGQADLELRCDRVDVAARAQQEGSNLEGVARHVRYEWLTNVAKETGSTFVATGHTAEDQAETVLHHLLRGTGLKGLRGIAPRRPLVTGVEVVRPLLEVSRTDVLAFLASEGQAFRQDSSNLDLRYTRNRIRHELLPQLARDYNTGIVAVLCQLAELATAAYFVDQEEAAALLADAERPRAGSRIILDRGRLAGVPRNRLRELFRVLWAREGWSLGGMGYRDWDRLAAVACGELPAADLPGGVRACAVGRVVQVGRGA
jgi:tRNA(Ile)-lysidine synthase